MIRTRRPQAALAPNTLRTVCIVAVMVMGIGAGACMGTQRTPPLDETLRSYNDGVRWQRFTAAAAHVPATQRDEFLDERDQISEDLRISEYEVIRVRHDRTGRMARAHVKFTWHLDSRGVVHTTHTVQSWQLQGNGWVLASERHLRGEPMPGVPAKRQKDPEADRDDNDRDDNDRDEADPEADRDEAYPDEAYPEEAGSDEDSGEAGDTEPAGSGGDALRPGVE